jgi:hypothetical protein
MSVKQGPSYFKIGKIADGKQTGRCAFWWCPRCDSLHMAYIDFPNHLGAKWHWDGNLDKPTLSPSVLCRLTDNKVCHCHIRNGQIAFCSDTAPATYGTPYAGKTVPLPDLPDWFTEPPRDVGPNDPEEDVKGD